MQDVEDHEAALLLAAVASTGGVHARAHRGEVRAAVGVQTDDLCVEQRRLSPEPPAGLRDELRKRGTQAWPLRERSVVPRQLPAEPVPLDLSRPARSLGHAAAAARAAALDLAAALDGDPRTAVLVDPELDMVCCLPAGASASAAADPAFATLAADGWHVAKLRVRPDWLREHQPNVEADQPTTTVLRCCLRRREHAAVGDLAAALGEHLAAAATRVSEASAAARPAR